jgi:hypothetical protein
MQKTCTHCSQAFDVSDDDLAMLDRLSPVIGGTKQDLPPPTQCPDCRLQRRQAQVNQLNLYERKCDLTGASVISNIRPDSPYTVYRQQEWYGDSWDALSYGRDFDFNRPFFEQWKELCAVVPRPNLFTGYEFDDNSDYTNHSGKNKNCYLIFDSDENRDSYYSYSINGCTNCVDCFRTRKSELCYECIDCVQCYGSAYLQECDNCSDSMFLKNCTGCRNCLMCSNLKNKEYYVENKPVSKEEFEQFRKMLGSFGTVQSAKERFETLKLEYPQRFMHGISNENCVGDYLVHCKDAYRCFDTEDLYEGRYVYQGFMPLKTCMDVQECGEGELLYECSVCGYDIHGCTFCHHTLGSMSDLHYCSLCPHSKNCFGSIGLRRKEYCVLNKQYTKEQYEELAPKIIEHMRKTGEWGEFFPLESSVYAYNETLAQDYYPLAKKEVEKEGLIWLDEVEKRDQYMGPPVDLPDSISDVHDDVTKQILTCGASGKQYKIIPQELAFYRQMHLPLPRRSFFQRHKDRMAMRNPRALFDRMCDNCKKSIETTYSPDRPEIVYCEECFQNSLS